MSRYKAYPEYTISKVKWLEKVPKYWEIKRLKFLAQIKNGHDYKEFESYNGEYPVIGSGGEFARSEKYLYKEESVLLGRKGTIDKPIYINCPFWTVDTMFYTKISKQVIAKYFYYCCLTINFKYYSTNTAVPSMTQGDLGNNYFAIPNKEEQQKIADFLDYETSKIDQLINKQKALIELLKEKRQALISQAVTKGLNPKAKMKDSGIEWLGEVPKHWIISKAKYVSDIFIPQRNKPELNDSNEGVPWITIEDVKKGTIINGKYFVSDEVRTMASSKILKKESVIASCVGDFGIVAINKVDVIINQQLQAFIPYAINNEYLKYSIENSKCYFEAIGTAATLIYVNQQGFENLPILIPPLAEQISIINFLSKGLDKIDVILDKTKQSIGLLQERRTALISAAVTGKIDVRDWQSPNAIDTMTNITPN